MKKLVAVAAAVLVLAGCSAAPSDDLDGAQPFVSSDKSASTERAASPEPEFAEDELAFLEWMKSETVAPNVAGKSQEELLSAGRAACKMFDEGVAYGEMELIDGGHENNADNDIASLASQFLCTEHDITVTD